MQIIAVHFNPCRYKKLQDNLLATIEASAYKIDVVELVYDDDEQQIPGSHVVHASRKDQVLWHKESLINIGMSLSDDPNVCWIDGDVVFESREWAAKTEAKLEHYAVVQPFDQCAPFDLECSEIFPSFAAVYQVRRNPTWHAKPGYAFAWRRSIGQLPDLGICGGGDLLTWIACSGWWSHPLLTLFAPAWRTMILSQSIQFSLATAEDIGVAYNRLYYMAHGSHTNRRYNERYTVLNNMDFDPSKHLERRDNGLWAWTDTTFNDAMLDYFQRRQDDE